jgi:hypothetical protein
VRQRDQLRERADVLLERQQQLLADLSRSSASGSSEPRSSELWSSPRPASNWDPTGFPSKP